MNPWLIAAGAGIGYLRAKEEQKTAAELNKAEAVKTRFSPWTGMKGDIKVGPSTMGSMMQGGVTGAMMGDFEDSETGGDIGQDKTGGKQYSLHDNQSSEDPAYLRRKKNQFAP